MKKSLLIMSLQAIGKISQGTSMTTQDNNEAASAPGLQSRINAELAKVFKDDPANACRAHAAITAVLAASASQSSTAGADTSVINTEFFDRLAEYEKAPSLTARMKLAEYVDSLAHVARQRQESTSEYSQVSSEHSAAVAEGVDTAELRRLTFAYGEAIQRGTVPQSSAAWGNLIDYLTKDRAQQREAGRREKQAEFDAIFDAFGIGSEARTCSVLMANLRNTLHFANLLHAVEREFFMVPGEPDEDHPDEAPGEECMLNCWGSTVEQYIEQFRSALAALARQPVSEGLTEAQRRTATELLACFMSWEPQVLVLGNVRADDSANLLRAILYAVPPAKAEGMSDTERLDCLFSTLPVGQLCTALGVDLPASTLPRPLNDWARAQLDRAILAQQAKGEKK